MKNPFELLPIFHPSNDLSAVVACNDKTSALGLTLSKEDAIELVHCKNESLKQYGRVEIGPSILEKLIFTFCDSEYIWQSNYLETLECLGDIFYQYKSESMDLISDDELLNFMREQFDGVCYGDLYYLESTCLQRFCQAIHSGYRGYIGTEGHGEYEQFDEEPRWDHELYFQILKELIWD